MTTGGAEQIFISGWEVSLTPIEGTFIPFSKGDEIIRETKAPENPHEPISATDKQGNAVKVYLGATPSFAIKHKSSKAGKEVEEILKQPLIKVAKEEGKTCYSGLRSGGRSALIYSENSNKYYRLKGCGNYIDQEKFRYSFPGIPLRDLTVFGEKLGIEVRGCSFLQFSLRELMICNLLEQKIKEYSDFDPILEELRLGNSSVGYWIYNLDYDLNPHPDITITCSLFETLGERRLASHLLAGVDILLQYGILDFPVEEVREKLLHREGPETEYSIVTYAACCSGKRANPCDFVDNCSFRLNFAALDELRNNFEGEIAREWDESCETLKLAPRDSRNPLLFLYWRLGREVGEFARFLEANNVMWGYYFDYNPCEPHCNAHPNNFLIIPPSEGRDGKQKRFLAPLDFDMAFTKETFFSPYTSAPDDELFVEWKKSELSELERALGGDVANDGLALEQAKGLGLQPSTYAGDSFEVVFNAMRDTLLAGCRSAYSMQQDAHPADTHQDNSVLNAVVKLGLILTRNIQS